MINKILKELAENAAGGLSTMQLPKLPLKEKEKNQRLFRIGEVADLLEISESHLRNLEESDRIPTRHSRDGKEEGSTHKGWFLPEINQIRDVVGLNPFRKDGDKPFILVNSNFKDNVGKTTSAVTFSQFCALHGYRVLLVDLDPQADATRSFFSYPEITVHSSETLVDYLTQKTKDLQGLPQQTHWPRLDLIPANHAIHCAGLLKDYATIANWMLLKDGLEGISDDYDIIVIDSPSSSSFLAMNGLYAADGVLVPLPPAIENIASLHQHFKILSSAFDLFEESDKLYNFVKILITHHDGTIQAREITNAIFEAFSNAMIPAILYSSESIGYGDFMNPSPYEIDATSFKGNRRKGNRRCLEKAREILSQVDAEILRDIRLSWPSAKGAAEQSSLISL